MEDLWDKVRKTVAELYTTATEKAVEGVNLGVKKFDEAGLRRELTKEFANLGGRTYQLLQRGDVDALADDPTIRFHLDRLKALETRLEEKEKEISELRGSPVENPAEPDVPEPAAAPGPDAASSPDSPSGDAPRSEQL